MRNQTQEVIPPRWSLQNGYYIIPDNMGSYPSATIVCAFFVNTLFKFQKYLQDIEHSQAKIDYTRNFVNELETKCLKHLFERL